MARHQHPRAPGGQGPGATAREAHAAQRAARGCPPRVTPGGRLAPKRARALTWKDQASLVGSVRVTTHDFDWLVIGSGFGGSVSALRLAEKGHRVGVFEQGRRYSDEDL